MSVKAEDIATLVEMFEASNWDELHVEVDGLHLFLSTDPNARLASGVGAAVPHPPVASVAATPVEAARPAVEKGSAASAAVTAATPTAATGAVPSSWIAVTAPNLGTFYRSPKPGAAPFVEIGQSIDAEAEICLLEVMKLFTAVKSGVTGVVRQICVKDADMVEFGQTLFYVEPV